MVLQGAESCPAAYANEGFDAWNSILWFDKHHNAFYLCLRGRPREEQVYELMTNYGIAGEPSSYWTPDRLALLDPDTKSRCLSYYPPGTPSLVPEVQAPMEDVEEHLNQAPRDSPTHAANPQYELDQMNLPG